MDTAYARCIDNNEKMQQDCLVHGNTTTRIEVVYGKKYIVVSYYAGKKDFKKIICDYAFNQALTENNQSA